MGGEFNGFCMGFELFSVIKSSPCYQLGCTDGPREIEVGCIM
jgi:hypothetical protein